MNLRDVLTGAVVMAPMTKGSNLPYRRLCVELGARVTISEMTVARRLKQRKKGEFALIRKFEGEPFFGVQLAGTNPEEIGWAAALVESRGADLVDLNCGCPIDHFTHKGIGAALGRQPARIRRITEAMKKAVTAIPVTVKLRLGWNDEMRNVIEQAQAAVDGGADALFVHGRTRNARYRFAADWDAIGSVVAAVPVPVVGNGDILFPHDVEQRAGAIRRGRRDERARRPDQAVAVSRDQRRLSRSLSRRAGGDLSPLRHAGPGTLGRRRARPRARAPVHALAHRLLASLRAAPRGRLVSRASRCERPSASSRLRWMQFLARTDDAAHEYLADCLTFEREIDLGAAPSAESAKEPEFVEAEG